MDWLSLLVPFLYLFILLGSLSTFSSLYRRRKALASASLELYFPPHTSRNVYFSLQHLKDHDPSAPNVPESTLRAALLARAVEDIHRIIEIRTRKGPLATLLQRGVVGDEIWQRLVRAETELEEEVKDVVQEVRHMQTHTSTQSLGHTLRSGSVASPPTYVMISYTTNC